MDIALTCVVATQLWHHLFCRRPLRPAHLDPAADPRRARTATDGRRPSSRPLTRALRSDPMRAVLQRVTRASVEVEGQVVGRIGVGWLVLLGVAKGDLDEDADRLADKVVGLRAFEDDAGKMNLARRRGRAGRCWSSASSPCWATAGPAVGPSFIEAAEPAEAERLYLRFADRLRGLGLAVETGDLPADMKVELLNDGPVTLLLDSRKAF